MPLDNQQRSLEFHALWLKSLEDALNDKFVVCLAVSCLRNQLPKLLQHFVLVAAKSALVFRFTLRWFDFFPD